MAEVEPLLDRLLANAGEDGPEICAAVVAGYVQNYEFKNAEQFLGAWIGDYPDDPEPRDRTRKDRHALREFSGSGKSNFGWRSS